ncbi:hypothetical protein A6R68_09619, partial [Neotoma lepida]
KPSYVRKAVCCFDCIPCLDNEISNATDIDQYMQCPDNEYANMWSKIIVSIVSRVAFLAYEDGSNCSCSWVLEHSYCESQRQDSQLHSIHLCPILLSLFPDLHWTSQHGHLFLQDTAFGVLFTVVLSTVLAKTITVGLASHLAHLGRKMRDMLMLRAPKFIISFCALIQLSICGIWLGTSPLFVGTDVHSQHGPIFILCNKGLVTAFY